MPKYSDCTHAARQELENGSTAFLSCRNSCNMELLLFLQNCKDKLQKEIGDGPKPRMLEAIEKTCRNVRDHQSRIYKLEHLEALKGTGNAVVGMVKLNLWNEYPPEPASEEELALETRQTEAAWLQKAKEKERKKKMRAEAAEAAARGEMGGGAGPDPLRDDEMGGQPKKKAARTAKGRKEYIPNKGDANWAVMLMLLKHCHDGKTFMTKQELCEKTESSGLLKPNVSMYPQATATARPGQMQINYCGWSSFKTLVNREPPLCLAYSAPKKIKLTNEGEAMAIRLYKDAALAGYIDWRIPDIQLDPEGMSQPAPSPALPQARAAAPQALPRPPAQAFRSSQASHASHSQHMHSCSFLPTSNGRSQAKGRALEPQGPSNSPSWEPPSTSRAIPGVSRLQSDLLMHPSSSIRAFPEEEELSLSQRLSQSQALSQTLSQSASQPLHDRQAAASRPVAAQQLKRKHNEEAILMVMEAADCSYDKAQEALADGCSVNRAVEKLFSISEEEDDDMADFGSGAFTSQVADPNIPMGASQSNPPSQTVTASDSQRDRGPSQKRPPGSAPASSILTHPASLSMANALQAQMLDQTQPLSHEYPSMSRQPSGTSGGTLGREGSAGVAKPSRLAAPEQGRASGCSQGSQAAGHTEAARMESSSTSWKLPSLGTVGSIEEQGIRMPPLSPGCRFSDEYELVLIIDSREQYSNKEKSRADSLERHIQLVRDRNIAVEVRGLQQGDVLWIAKPRRYGGVEYVMDYILERKQVDDLHQSIKDRRYDRQKYDMQRCGLRHLMYLVEGDPNAQQEEIAQKAVKTASVHTEVIDGFQILRSAHCTATMQSLAEWTKALKRKYDNLTEQSPQVQKGEEALPTYEAFRIRSAQLKKRTVQDVWGLMLTNVPGWSDAMVEAVLKQYGTPLLLYRAYMQAMQTATRQGRDAVEAARQLLVSCQLSQNRRPISVNNSAKVFDLLFANGWHCV